MRTDNTNPYVGLRPFDVDESLLFFGRNDQTLELLQRLHQHHFVAVVGSSGSGKSSLLRAGLIPALKAGYLVEDSDHWFIAIMKPGQSPLYNLAEAILTQINSRIDEAAVSALVEKIKEEGADALLNLLTPIRKERTINFFLLVDQFEELFRFTMDQSDVAKKDEAIDFVNIMLELSQQSIIPFYVVITMRSDFIGDCAQFYGLPEAMNRSQYLVPRLNRVQLKTVIEGPAKLYGGKLNPSLTSRLLNDLGKVKDELPLLQHALMRIWDYEMTVNKSGELDLKDYERIGGIDRALSNHADEALAGMSGPELMITKTLFQALTAIDENGRKIRRPVLLSQLEQLTGTKKEQLLTIITLFIKDKRSFLVMSNAGKLDDKVIDISHESLIRQWYTLSQWVDQEGESATNYLRLAESAELYKQKQKDLLTGSELQIALGWYNKFKPAATWANRYKEGFEENMAFLMGSEKESTAKQKQEEERRQQEEERQKKEKAGKQKQRYLTFVIVFLLLVAIGAGLATYSFINKNSEITAKSNELEKYIDSLAQEKTKAEKAQIELKDAQNSLLSLIGSPVFNFEKYAKEKGIPRSAANSKDEPLSAFKFPAASDEISIKGFLEPLAKTKRISVVVILKPNSGDGAIIDATQGYNGFYLGLNRFKPRVDIYYGSPEHSFKDDFSRLDNNSWSFLLFTYSGETDKIIVQKDNGEPAQRQTFGKGIKFGSNSNDFTIGGKELFGGPGNNKYGSATFNGLIENILVYDHVLTEDEVSKLQRLYNHLFVKPGL